MRAQSLLRMIFRKFGGGRGQSTTSSRYPISNPNRGWGCPISVTILAIGPMAGFGPTFWPILIRD